MKLMMVAKAITWRTELKIRGKSKLIKKKKTRNSKKLEKMIEKK
jgi:hypothetical protein